MSSLPERIGIGTTFLPIGSVEALRGEAVHLTVVATAGDHPDDEVLLAPITTHRGHPGHSECVLEPGDHPFIRHCMAVRLRDIHQSLSQGSIKLREPMAASVVERIQEAARESGFIAAHLKGLLPPSE